MNLDWIQSPFTMLALLGLGAITGLSLFMALKKEIAEGQARHEEQRRALESSVERMRATLESLERALEQAEERSAAPALPISGMNLSRRSQVLRMHRRGEAPVHIAAALRIPRNEVDLLLKVHRTVISRL